MSIKNTTYAANVLMSFDEDAAHFLSEKLVLGGNLDKIFTDIENQVDPVNGTKKSYLLGSGPTGNILNFTHTFNFAGGSTGGAGMERANLFVLTLLDPEGIFESIFIERIASRLSLDEPESLELPKEEESFGDPQDFLFEDTPSTFDEQNVSFFGEGESVLDIVSQVNDPSETLPGFVRLEEAPTEKEKKIVKDYLDPVGTPIWISYGIGTNANDWAGPFSAKFIRANMTQPKGGARQITLHFLSSNGIPMGSTLDDGTFIHKDHQYNIFVPLLKEGAFSKPPENVDELLANLEQQEFDLINQYLGVLSPELGERQAEFVNALVVNNAKLEEFIQEKAVSELVSTWYTGLAPENTVSLPGIVDGVNSFIPGDLRDVIPLSSTETTINPAVDYTKLVLDFYLKFEGGIPGLLELASESNNPGAGNVVEELDVYNGIQTNIEFAQAGIDRNIRWTSKSIKTLNDQLNTVNSQLSANIFKDQVEEEDLNAAIEALRKNPNFGDAFDVIQEQKAALVAPSIELQDDVFEDIDLVIWKAFTKFFNTYQGKRRSIFLIPSFKEIIPLYIKKLEETFSKRFNDYKLASFLYGGSIDQKIPFLIQLFARVRLLEDLGFNISFVSDQINPITTQQSYQMATRFSTPEASIDETLDNLKEEVVEGESIGLVSVHYPEGSTEAVLTYEVLTPGANQFGDTLSELVNTDSSVFAGKDVNPDELSELLFLNQVTRSLKIEDERDLIGLNKTSYPIPYLHLAKPKGDTYYRPVNTFFDNLTRISNKEYSPIIFYEGHLQYINYFEKLFGVDTFKKGVYTGLGDFLNKDKTSVMIVGDSRLILSILYLPLPSSNKSIAEIQLESSVIEINLLPNHWKSTLELIKDKRFSEIPDIGALDLASFGSINKIPDEFALDDDVDILRRLTNTPIFRYGVEDPNVLAVQFDIQDQYTAALRAITAFHPLVGLLNSVDTTAIKSRLLTLSSKVIVDARVKPIVAKGTAEEELLNKFLGHLPLEEQIAIFRLLIRTLQRIDTQDTPQRFIEAFADISIESHLADVLETLSEYSLKGTITTLPLFRLSSGNALFKNVILLYQEPRIAQRASQPKPINKIFTGHYTIFGFKHEISQTRVESAFHVYRRP